MQNLIDTQGFIILDGGFATECEQQGASCDDELWSAKLLFENPDLIENVHLKYFEAGADIAITSSYQASFQGFEKKGYDPVPLFKKSIELAKNARERFVDPNRQRPIIATSIGPYGAFLADGSEYKGNYGVSKDFLKDFHRPRIQVLYEDTEIFAFETIPCIIEAEAIRYIFSLNEEIENNSDWDVMSLEKISDLYWKNS